MSIKMNLLINSARMYARWVSRRPSKMLEPKHLKAFDNLGKTELEEYTKVTKSEPKFNKDFTKDYERQQSHSDENVTELRLEDFKSENKFRNYNENAEQTHEPNKPRRDKPKKEKFESKKPNIKENFIVTDAETNFEYEKLKMGDHKFTTIMTSVKSRKTRLQTNQILLEGRRLIRDALLANMKLQTLMFSKVEHLKYLSNWLKNYERDANCVFYKVPHGDMALWSDLTTNPGIMALFTRPDQYYIPQNTETPAVPITVICDNIREPSNLGSIIRTCAAIPCHQLLLMKGCVDPWDTKVLRAGSGGHFRLTLVDDILWPNVNEHLPDNCQVFIADSNTQKGKVNLPLQSYNEVNFKSTNDAGEKHTVIVIGGETEGISLDAYQFADFFNGNRLHIPIAQGVDSLNTAIALSILTFEMRRQMLC